MRRPDSDHIDARVGRISLPHRGPSPPPPGSGVPTSLENSGQQWDFPNAWPPLQHVLVESLNQMGTEKAGRLAYSLAQKWIDTNYLSYMEARPHAMFEKVRGWTRGLSWRVEVLSDHGLG